MTEKQTKERLTSQKKIILNYLRSVKIHPSADKVYSVVRKKLPRISKGTVYRILRNLKDKGEILELPCKECQRYDGDISNHGHFFCRECKDVFDIFEDFKIPKLKKIKVGEINNYQISFYGTCKKCEK